MHNPSMHNPITALAHAPQRRPAALPTGRHFAPLDRHSRLLVNQRGRSRDPEPATISACGKSRTEAGECTGVQDLVYMTLNSRKTRPQMPPESKKGRLIFRFCLNPGVVKVTFRPRSPGWRLVLRATAAEMLFS